MIAPVPGIHLTFSAQGSNADPYLGEGWHGAENGHRWTDGLSSVVRLPPMRARAWFALTLQCSALTSGGASQRLTVALNGIELKRCQPGDLATLHIVVPGELVRENGENILVLHHPDAVRPSETEPGNRDDRLLALAFHSLEVEGLEDPIFLAPRLLPEVAPPATIAEAKVLSEAFQSLGKNCDLGMFQRKFGAEPFGLLRFAAIRPERLVMGLKTRFAGIGDVDKLSFHLEPDGKQIQGLHADYGLYYHTFKLAEETNFEELAGKEAQRLKFLARLLIEQLENDEKIFLRHESFDAPEEAWALHQLMRCYNPRARLFLVSLAPAHMPERIGRVVELRSGLYRGYLSRLSDPSRTPDRPIFEEWLKLCAAVVADERGRPFGVGK